MKIVKVLKLTDLKSEGKRVIGDIKSLQLKAFLGDKNKLDLSQYHLTNDYVIIDKKCELDESSLNVVDAVAKGAELLYMFFVKFELEHSCLKIIGVDSKESHICINIENEEGILFYDANTALEYERNFKPSYLERYSLAEVSSKEELIISSSDEEKNFSNMWDVISIDTDVIDGEHYTSPWVIGFILQYGNNFFAIGITEKQFESVKKDLPINLEDKESVYNIFMCERYSLFNIANPESEFYKEFDSDL